MKSFLDIINAAEQEIWEAGPCDQDLRYSFCASRFFMRCSSSGQAELLTCCAGDGGCGPGRPRT